MSNKNNQLPNLPDPETLSKELGSAKSIDDFFGKEGIFARMFGKTLETMLEAEMDNHLGYSKHDPKGYNSGNSRNGTRSRKIRTSLGDQEIEIPRDRNGDYKPRLLKNYSTSSNEIEDKIVTLYSRGMTVQDIQESLSEMYGINVSDSLISQITGKVMPLVEEWRVRPLDSVYPIVYLDATHVKLRRERRVLAFPVHICLALNTEGKKEILGIWLGEEKEGANFWLSVITDLQQRGVKDILIAAVDGLTGFKDAIQSVYPNTVVQRCVIHQIRNSLKYVSWKDKKAFMQDLKGVYKALDKKEAKVKLTVLAENWGKQYALSVRSWENSFEDLTQYFEYPEEIRRIMYTTNIIEGFNRQIKKAIKTKSVFPNEDSLYKMLYLSSSVITKKWVMPIRNWANIYNQLAIKFEGRLPMR